MLDDQELFDLQKIVRGDKNAVKIAVKVLPGSPGCGGRCSQ
jgi:hypothetical protein